MTIPVYHQLAVWKHGNVMAVRFGEHRILDELAVRNIGDELYAVAERADCPNVVLNFVGVVGVSSLMIGRLLLLQRRIISRGGKLKLCEIGPDLQEVVSSTKLDQIFDIWDTEQDALAAFGKTPTPATAVVADNP
jgi:anti-sigma B factor antagonist